MGQLTLKVCLKHFNREGRGVQEWLSLYLRCLKAVGDYSVLNTLHWVFWFPGYTGWDSGMRRKVPYIGIFTAIQLCLYFSDREETRAVFQEGILIPVDVDQQSKRGTLITNHQNPPKSLTWSIISAFIPFSPPFFI